MFKHIRHISDVQPFVAHKNEIRFYPQPNGITMSMYIHMDSKTFDSPEARECRGSAYDEDGNIVSRPLHKFFNMGEKDYLTPDKLKERTDIVAVFDKLDGSMVATSCVNLGQEWRSKKAFDSDIVKLTREFLQQPENVGIEDFAYECAVIYGMTAIFELTHPKAQIVVPQNKAEMRLLHVRHNITGEYVMLNPDHHIHELIRKYNIPVVPRHLMTMEQVLSSLETMEYAEGYVVQFADGDMVKMKCPWYTRLHRSITFLRERDIAVLAVNEQLDDMKQHMREVGIPLDKVEEVETRLMGILIGIEQDIDALYQADKHLDKKAFAMKNSKHPLFGLAMNRYNGVPFNLNEWYSKKRLKEDFGLKSLLEGAQAEAVEG
jgi:RNA ligase